MRIGFVAITGLRVANTDLLELGMQFPALSRRAEEIASLPSLGLLTLAGMTPDRFGRRFLEIDDPVTCDLPLDCDVIAITALAATEREVIELARRCRAAGVSTIIGGLHATLQPEKFREAADALVIGEGEVVWPLILENLEAGELRPIYDSRPIGPFDFRRAPMPAFEMLGSGEGRRFTVQTQRGCPWRCDFCAASMRLAPHQSKPVEGVVAEVNRIADLYGADFIEFADDNTFANRKHGRALLDALAGTGVRFFAETDLSVADDPELLDRLRDAGCRELLIGFESPDFGALDGVEERANWKAKRVDDALRAVEKIQGRGIAVCGCFVLGLDGAGPESFFQVEDFVRRSGLFDVQLTYLTPFPGTPLHRRLSEEGRLLAESSSDGYTLFDITFQPDPLSLRELEDGYRTLMSHLYGDEAVRDRRRRFFGHLRRRLHRERAESREPATSTVPSLP